MTIQPALCPACSSEIASGLLSCPSCARLVHADRLTELAATATQAENAGDWSGALAAWREMAALLPPGARQRAAAEQKIVALSERARGAPSARNPRNWWKKISALGPVGVIAAMLGKAKFLLLGFTKLSTLASFVVAFSVYWTLWGWQFALCFLLSMYIHEMGHVAALRRYGVPATAPMFIPGLGAFVRLRQSPANAVEDARVGLAGPIWGTMAALGSLAIYALTNNPFWAGVARAGALLNLFNLIPVWQLDGGRGIRSLDRTRVGMLAALTALMWMATSEGLLLLLAILLAFRAATKHDNPPDDWVGLAQFAGLIVALALFCLIPIPRV